MDCRSSYSRLHLLLNLRHSIPTHRSISHEKLRKCPLARASRSSTQALSTQKQMKYFAGTSETLALAEKLSLSYNL